MNQTEMEYAASNKQNQAAVERIKSQAQTEADDWSHKKQTEELLQASEAVWFEDDREITLRDGKIYKIPPLTFSDAREFAKLTQVVDTQAIILNFLDVGRGNRYENLVRMMKLAFKNYPQVDDVFIDRYIDLRLAGQIVDLMLDINAIKN